jgi:hypothetical protein
VNAQGAVNRQAAGLFHRALDQLVRRVFPNGDPLDAPSDIPLVLLPIRIETRFSADQRQLRVRMYPDEIHFDRLEPGLTDDERSAGVAYWQQVWDGGSAAEERAWRDLVHATRPERAEYVAFALTPTNLDLRPADPGGPAPAPAFPATAPPAGKAAAARALPDRFLALAIQGQDTSAQAGNPIPEKLTIGLAPGGNETDLRVMPSGARVGPGMEWMVDFDEAEKVGMALTMQLVRPGAVDRLLVMGIRSSLDPDAATAELDALLRAHRFADGLAFVPQGTPTNNTETDRTNWQSAPAPVPVPTRPPAAVDPDSNAARLASALGLQASEFDALEHGSDREQANAHAANTALWSPSFGTFLAGLFIPLPGGASLDDDRRERTRDLFQDHVRGRGPLPAVRIGSQPYGLLPTSSVDRRWQPNGNDPLERSLTPLLRRIRGFWRESLDNVPRLGSGALDATLLEILGSSPTLQGLRVRSVASQTFCSTAQYIVGVNEDNTVVQEKLDRMLWGTLGFDPAQVGLGKSLGATTRPVGLPLVHEHDPQFIAALLSDSPRTVESVLQALLELARDQEQAALAQASPPDLIGPVLARAGDAVGELHGQLANVVAQGTAVQDPAQLHALADRVQSVAGPSGPSLLVEHQPVAAVRGSLAEVALQPQLAQDAGQSLALQTIGAWLRAGARYNEFIDALRLLAGTSLQERSYLIAETLDLASHRLDAWITSLPAQRLEQLRARQPTGAVIGAYGWVEDLQPDSATTRDGGWIHAPSLGHAATAGVLRSAYLTHNPDAEGSGALSIDLSSARVRRALALLDGVRSGQPLAALLGYLIERRLHERSLDRFVASLRALAPLLAGQLTDHGEALPQPARESIAANNVIDGLALLALDRGKIQAALITPPANNPYLDPGTWRPPSGTEWNDITDVLNEAQSANDAVADLLLAEGVHQLVGGNIARAGAALEAAAAGDAPPVAPDFVRSPTRGVAITHRMLLLMGDAQPGGSWAVDAPRAAAEPRLEAWAQSLLGPAESTVLHAAADGTRTTLAEARLSALDFVYDAADPAMLERRIRAALPALGNALLADARDPGWPAGLRPYAETLEFAGSLQRLLAGGRAAGREDFARPSDKPTRTIGDLAGVQQRIQTALAALTQAEADLAALLALNASDQNALATATDALAAFGIPIAGAGAGLVLTVAQAADAEARRRISDAQSLLSKPFDASIAVAAGKAIFGEGFWILPPIQAGPPDLFTTALGALTPPPAQIRRFLRDCATVRDGVARYGETLLFADALGVRRELRIAQLAEAGTPGTAQWVALPFDPATPSPDRPVTSIVVDAPAWLAGGDTMSGLVLDEWGEVAPRRVQVGGPDGPNPPEARALTGVAVNANAPGVRAPQAILVGVSPDEGRWDSQVIADMLEETLELAKLRGVTLERALWAGRILPALLEQSWSLQGEKVIDGRLLAPLSAREVLMPYVKD